MVQKFASNVYGFMWRMIYKQLKKCVIDTVASPCSIKNEIHRPSAKRL
jgi:hypothetical protein